MCFLFFVYILTDLIQKVNNISKIFKKIVGLCYISFSLLIYIKFYDIIYV